MTGNLFGTTGVRKIYGTEFDLSMALKLGKALGTYLGEGTVVLARDARTTGPMIEDALAAGILSTGVNVTKAGMIPTPTLAFITRHLGYNAGLMVTASHNPPEYTGVKFWGPDSMGYTPEMEREIESIYAEEEFQVAKWDGLGEERTIDNAVDEHVASLLEQFDSEIVESKEYNIVVDPGNGAGSVLTPYLMRRLACKVISINSQPDGHFPGRASEPDKESLTDLIKVVTETNADLGIAHDGDADRVVFVTEKGEVIRGDRTIALLAQEELKRSKKKAIVTTVDSSRVVDETVEKSGGKTIRTPVGDIQVALKMKETGASFGGEAAGVFIFSEFHDAPEPFLTACKVLALMASTGHTFGELISEIPAYPLRKAKVKCSNDKKSAVMSVLVDSLPNVMKDAVEVITVDGIGVSLKAGWVLVRPSGTEPVIRVTCEAPSDEQVGKILTDAKAEVERVIDSL
ncbi:MAG: phosphoglucosamine mutase [Candidatus Thorarchaeota archaeon]|jgi:phosphoglucosamine mutase